MTAELAGIAGATSNPMMFSDALALGAVDAVGVEKAHDELKDSGVFREVFVEFIKGVTTLRCGTAFRGVPVALAHAPHYTRNGYPCLGDNRVEKICRTRGNNSAP